MVHTGLRLVLIRREIENKHLAPFFKFRALVLVTVKLKKCIEGLTGKSERAEFKFRDLINDKNGTRAF